MTTAIRKLIAENKWKLISEAKRNDDLLVAGEQCHAVVYWRFNEWEPCSILTGNSDFDPFLSFEPTHFRPLPDDRLALVAEAAILALERMRNENSDSHGIAKYALQKAEAIAEGKE